MGIEIKLKSHLKEGWKIDVSRTLAGARMKAGEWTARESGRSLFTFVKQYSLARAIDISEKLSRHVNRSLQERPLAFLPMLLGFVGLVGSVVYQIQRTGAFSYSFHSFDRFIQHHLDAVSGDSALSALLGVLAGLVILRSRGRSRLVEVGTVFSLLVLVWCEFGLSLWNP